MQANSQRAKNSVQILLWLRLHRTSDLIENITRSKSYSFLYRQVSFIPLQGCIGWSPTDLTIAKSSSNEDDNIRLITPELCGLKTSEDGADEALATIEWDFQGTTAEDRSQVLDDVFGVCDATGAVKDTGLGWLCRLVFCRDEPNFWQSNWCKR